ncbi:MAG: hypothetical protein ABH832_01260 [bacterium]
MLKSIKNILLNFKKIIFIIIACLFLTVGSYFFIARGYFKKFAFQILRDQQINENIATIQTPEQTYQILRTALFQEDIEEALSQFSEKYKVDYKKIFQSAVAERQLEDLLDKLPDSISKLDDDCFPVRCAYGLPGEFKKVQFIKNSRGIWLIESL